MNGTNDNSALRIGHIAGIATKFNMTSSQGFENSRARESPSPGMQESQKERKIKTAFGKTRHSSKNAAKIASQEELSKLKNQQELLEVENYLLGEMYSRFKRK